MLYGGIVARLGARPRGPRDAERVRVPDARRRLPLPAAEALLDRRGATVCATALAAWLMRAIVTVSPSLGRGFCRYNGIDAAALRVVPYGVDLERFAAVTAEQVAAFRARHGLAPGRDRHRQRRAGWSSRRTTRHSCARSRWRRRGNPALVMLLVGDGPLRGELEALARSAGHRRTGCGSRGHSARGPGGVARHGHLRDGVEVRALRRRDAGGEGRRAPPSSRPGSTRCPRSWAKTRPGDAAGRLVPAGGSCGDGGRVRARWRPTPAPRRALGARAAREAAVKHSLPAAIATYQKLYDELRGVTAQEVGVGPAL